MKIRRFLPSLLALVATLGLSSCGMGFRSDWKAALKAPSKPMSIEGAWEGHWISEVNGHTGQLLAVVGSTAATTAGKGASKDAGTARPVRYFARWGWLFRGSFDSVHQTHGHDGFTTFTADRKIGNLGHFHAEGMISADKFVARYEAAGDHGKFELKRPR
jgi:hypothetical protein